MKRFHFRVIESDQGGSFYVQEEKHSVVSYMPKIGISAKNCQKLPKICPKLSKNLPELPKIAQNCQKLPKIAKNCQKLPKIAQIAKNCPKLPKKD
jgi:hypothetical protein